MCQSTALSAICHLEMFYAEKITGVRSDYLSVTSPKTIEHKNVSAVANRQIN
jgi:hypothetical protein